MQQVLFNVGKKGNILNVCNWIRICCGLFIAMVWQFKKKKKNEVSHLINWKKDSCCICNFLLKNNMKGFDTIGNEIPYKVFTWEKNINFW